jgi:hypothetical protein
MNDFLNFVAIVGLFFTVGGLSILAIKQVLK